MLQNNQAGQGRIPHSTHSRGNAHILALQDTLDPLFQFSAERVPRPRADQITDIQIMHRAAPWPLHDIAITNSVC